MAQKAFASSADAAEVVRDPLGVGTALRRALAAPPGPSGEARGRVT